MVTIAQANAVDDYKILQDYESLLNQIVYLEEDFKVFNNSVLQPAVLDTFNNYQNFPNTGNTILSSIIRMIFYFFKQIKDAPVQLVEKLFH